MRHLAKPRDASFFRVFFNPYHYGVLTNHLILTEYHRTFKDNCGQNTSAFVQEGLLF